MKMVNNSKDTVRLPDLGLEIAPGEACVLPDAYCLRRRTFNGSFRPSVIMGLAPQLTPCEADMARWETVSVEELTTDSTAASKSSYMARGLPEGVAEVMAVKAVAEAKTEEELPPEPKEEAPPVLATAKKLAEEAKLPAPPAPKRRGRPKKNG